LPYIPSNQFFVEAGWRRGRYSAFVATSYVDEMRTRSGQGVIPDDERIESRLVTDLSARVHIRDRFQAFLRVQNITDEVYVVARRPAGLRPGLPRTASAGFSYDF